MKTALEEHSSREKEASESKERTMIFKRCFPTALLDPRFGPERS